MIDRLRTLQDETFCVSDRTLGSFRIVYFFFALAVYTPSSLRWAADYPDWLRNPPPGLPSLVGVPPVPILLAIQWAAIVFAAMGLLGFRTRVASLGYPAFMLLHHSVEFSFGKIDHDLLWIVLPVALSSSGWGAAHSLDCASGRLATVSDWPLRNSRAIARFYAVFAVALSTAAAVKVSGWLDPTFSTAADMVRFYRVVQPDEALLASAALRLPAVIWEAVDYATVAIEFAPLAFLFVPRAARKVVYLLVPFHLSILLVMGIDFSLYVLAYIPLVAHPEASLGFARVAKQRTPSQWAAIALASCAIWAWVIDPAIASLAGTGASSYIPALIKFALSVALIAAFARGPSSADERGPQLHHAEFEASHIRHA